MRLASLTWASDVSLLLEAARATKSKIRAWTVSELNDRNLDECINSLNSADAILSIPQPAIRSLSGFMSGLKRRSL